MELPSSAIIPAADEVPARAVPPVMPVAASPRVAASSSPDLLPELPLPVPKVAPKAAGSEPGAAPPAAVAAAAVPAAVPAPAAAPTPSTPEPPKSLPLEVQEQLFGVLRAALDASLGPLAEKQSQLEARLQWLYEQDKKLQATATATQAAVVAAAKAAPARPPQPSLSVDITPTEPLPPVAPKPSPLSIVQTSFGPVIEGAPKQLSPIEAQLANVGPIELPDFGQGRRAAGRLLLALLLAGVAAAIAAMILSHT